MENVWFHRNLIPIQSGPSWRTAITSPAETGGTSRIEAALSRLDDLSMRSQSIALMLKEQMELEELEPVGVIKMPKINSGPSGATVRSRTSNLASGLVLKEGMVRAKS